MELWTDGDFDILLEDATHIQKRMLKSRSKMGEEQLARIFSKQMFLETCELR